MNNITPPPGFNHVPVPPPIYTKHEPGIIESNDIAPVPPVYKKVVEEIDSFEIVEADGIGSLIKDNPEQTLLMEPSGDSREAKSVEDLIKDLPYTTELDDANVVYALNVVRKINDNYIKVMVGQEKLKETLLVALLSGGHVLLESVPGLAKTTAAHTLANSIGGKFSRIQCTPDLMPNDIIGSEIYNQSSGEFKVELGPVHANFVLLDEINRSSAKTQSAMLEAMQERQTSIGGNIYKLPAPFLVIATQNPVEQEGTYHLSEAQLDRFMLKDVLTYPTPAEEFMIAQRFTSGKLNSDSIEAVVSLEEVEKLQHIVNNDIFISEALCQYIVNLVHATRFPDNFMPAELGGLIEVGASTRAVLAFVATSKSVALLNGRNVVYPEDIKAVAERVLGHRIFMTYEADLQNVSSKTVIEHLLNTIPVP